MFGSKYIPIIFLLISCGGHRETKTNIHKFEFDSIVIQNNRTVTQNVRLNDIGTIEAKDNTKPFKYGDKWYYNTIISFDKSIIKDYKKEESNNKAEVHKKEAEKNKDTIRTDYTWAIVLSVLVVVIGFVVYFKY